MPKGCVQHSRLLMIDWEINGEGMHRLCHHLDTHSAGRCVIGLKQPRPASCPPEAAPKPPGTSAGDAQGLRWPPPAPRRQAEVPFQSWRGGSRLERRFYGSSFQHCTRSLPNESNTPEPQGARGAESLGARGDQRALRRDAPGSSSAPPSSSFSPGSSRGHLVPPLPPSLLPRGQSKSPSSSRHTLRPFSGPHKFVIFLVGRVHPPQQLPGERLAGADPDCERESNLTEPLLRQ